MTAPKAASLRARTSIVRVPAPGTMFTPSPLCSSDGTTDRSSSPLGSWRSARVSAVSASASSALRPSSGAAPAWGRAGPGGEHLDAAGGLAPDDDGFLAVRVALAGFEAEAGVVAGEPGGVSMAPWRHSRRSRAGGRVGRSERATRGAGSPRRGSRGRSRRRPHVDGARSRRETLAVGGDRVRAMLRVRDDRVQVAEQHDVRRAATAETVRSRSSSLPSVDDGSRSTSACGTAAIEAAIERLAPSRDRRTAS